MDDLEAGRLPAPSPRGPHRARGGWDWPRRSLLGGLETLARDRLLSLGSMVRYPGPGRVIIREADESTFVLILLDGVVKATGLAQDGRDVLLAIRMGGDLVGEFAALDGQPRSATVTTCGTVVARAVSQAELLGFMRRDPVTAQAINGYVVGKLRVANARRIDLTGTDAPTRVARVLHQVALAYGEPHGAGAVMRWPLTQPELATLAGAAEPTVQRTLRGLRKAGVVATGYRTITVYDLERLKDIAYP